MRHLINEIILNIIFVAGVITVDGTDGLKYSRVSPNFVGIKKFKKKFFTFLNNTIGQRCVVLAFLSINCEKP